MEHNELFHGTAIGNKMFHSRLTWVIIRLCIFRIGKNRNVIVTRGGNGFGQQAVVGHV